MDEASLGQSMATLNNTGYMMTWEARGLLAEQIYGPLSEQDAAAVELLRLYRESKNARFFHSPLSWLYTKKNLGDALRCYFATYPNNP